MDREPSGEKGQSNKNTGQETEEEEEGLIRGGGPGRREKRKGQTALMGRGREGDREGGRRERRGGVGRHRRDRRAA